MDEFEYLDVVLLASGCKVFCKNSCIHVLNIVMLLLVVLCYTATLFQSVEHSMRSGGMVLLSMLERYSHEVCGLAFIAILAYHQTTIRLLLLSAATDLSPRQRSCLKRHAASWLLIVFVTIAQETAFTGWHVAIDGEKNGPTHVLMDWLRCYHGMNNWFLGGVGVYTFFVKVIRFQESNYFDSLDERREELVPEADSNLAIAHRTSSRFRKDLLRTSVFIPCLWITHVFVKAPVVVLELGHPTTGVVKGLWYIMPLIYQMTAVGYVVYTCESCTKTTGRRIRDLLIFLMRENRIGDMPLIVRLLDRSADQQFSVWKAVTLDRKFFLGLLCSVVSFTIFFLQMAQRATGSRDGKLPKIEPRF